LLDRFSTSRTTLPALICVEYFWDRVLELCAWDWLQTMILLITASWVDRIIGVSQWWYMAPFPFLSWLPWISMFHIHSCIKVPQPYSPSITLFIYPPPPDSTLPLTWPVLHSCPSLFQCLFIVLWWLCLCILPVSILCLNQSNSPYYSSSPFSPTLWCSTVSGVFVCVLLLHICDIFCYSSLSFFLSFPPSTFGYMFCIYLYVYMI
jgi:hypothetical protein